MQKSTYLSAIQTAMTHFGGMASLKEINSFIKTKDILPSIHTNDNWERNVSAVIQRHCSETKSYNGAKNLFYSVYGIGEGFWGLLSSKSTDVNATTTPIEQRQIAAIKNDIAINETEKEMLIKARVGQGEFRTKLIKKYNKCIITGIDDTRLLIASHIKPWRSASNVDRLSSENGLLLSPLYDKLFDLGLITFNKNMKIVTSSQLLHENIKKIGINEDISYLQSPSIEFMRNMEFHRDIIFKE